MAAFRRTLPIALVFGVPIALAIVFSITASQITERERVKRLASAWGISEDALLLEKIETLASTNSPHGDLSLLGLEPSEPHEHDLLSTIEVTNSGIDLVFPHFGNGSIPGTSSGFLTTWTLANLCSRPATGRLEFFDDSGQPLSIVVNGIEASTVDFDLAVYQTARFVSSGSGPLSTGWARVRSTQPLQGSSSFGIRTGTGEIVTDVGVGLSTLGSEFTIFADTLGSSDTGVAVANPDSEDPLNLDFDLHRPDGTFVTSRSRELPPLGHLALFVSELFQGEEGIDEFEGSIHIHQSGASRAGAMDSDLQANGEEGSLFAGITLRSTGSILTSLPFVGPPSDLEITRLAFPHLADGTQGPLTISTSLILFNNTVEASTGFVDFFNSDGTPMELTIGSETSSQFDFSLAAGGVHRMKTLGGGGVKVGWARVTMDQPLSGSALFSIEEGTSPASVPASASRLVTEVGVPAAKLVERANLIVDSTGGFRTGLAAVYPLERSSETVTLNISLYDPQGYYHQSASIELDKMGHTSLFLDEIFETADAPVDWSAIDSGQAIVSSSDYFAILGLRSAGAKLTSKPQLFRQQGFDPSAAAEFEQTLAGTSPGLKWMLHQNKNDLSLKKVRISAPGLEVNSNELPVGDTLARGFFPREGSSRILEFVVSGEGSILFDSIIARQSGNFLQGQGRLQSTPEEGLVLEMELLDKEPFSKVGDTADQFFFFPPGIIQAPPGEQKVTLTTELISVPVLPDNPQPVIRRLVQEVEFQNPDPTVANLEEIEPQFPLPGQPLYLTGTNLVDNATVTFQSPGLDPVEIGSASVDGGRIVTVPPSGYVGGTIQVDNGSGPGNLFHTTVLFSPTFALMEAPVPDDMPALNASERLLLFHFEQPGLQHLVGDFFIDLFDVGLEVAGLDEDTPVGWGRMVGGTGSREYGIFFESQDEEVVTLKVTSEGGGSLYAYMNIYPLRNSIGEERGIGVAFEWIADIVDPIILRENSELQALEFALDRLPFQVREGKSRLAALASMKSFPTDVTGEESELTVTDSDVLVLNQETTP